MSYMDPTRRARKQTATYWAPGTQNDMGGETSGTPRLIKCRWETATDELLSVAYKVSGETVVSASSVFSGEPLKEGGYLYRGVSTALNPRSNVVGAFQIRRVAEIPSTSNPNVVEYVSYL